MNVVKKRTKTERRKGEGRAQGSTTVVSDPEGIVKLTLLPNSKVNVVLLFSRDRKRSRRNDVDASIGGSDGNVPNAPNDERRREKERVKDKSKDRRERRDRYKEK